MKNELSEHEKKRNKSTISLNKTLIDLLNKYLGRLPKGKRPSGQSRVITDIMARYDYIVRTERRALNLIFSEDEMQIMLINARDKEYMANMIPGAVLEGIEDEVEEVFNNFYVDRSVLLEKLRVLNISQQFALVDWLEARRASIDKHEKPIV